MNVQLLKGLEITYSICASFSEVNSFKCYIGSGSQFIEKDCLECNSNVGCLCAKAPNFMGNEERFCLPNPHNAKPPGMYSYF